MARPVHSGIRREDFARADDAFFQSLEPSERDRIYEEFQAAVRGERELDAEVKIRWPDGTIHYIKITSRTIRDESGKAARMVGLNYDITERKQFEDALQESEARYRRLADQLGEGLAVTGSTGFYTYCNRRFEEMFGYTPDEILQLTPLDLTYEHERDRLIIKMKERSEGHSDQYEMQLRRKNGSPLDCLLSVRPLRDDYLGSLALFTDIAERKRLEESLRRAEKGQALSEMAAGVAHDFNNLFQSVLTNLDIAQSRMGSNAPGSPNVAKAAEGLIRAAGLSQQILQFTGASLRNTEKISIFSWVRHPIRARAADL